MGNGKQAAVVALNGFLGDRRNIIDVGELVNARAIAFDVPFYTTRRGGPAHGGWNIISKRRLSRWIVKKMNGGFSLVFVGKSYGAHWILDFYEKLSVGKCAHALLFDPSRSLRPLQKVSRKVPHGDTVTVVRQLGRRSGYRVRHSTDIVIDAKHTDIESQQQSQVVLDRFLDLHLA